jgi:hypothetical protein
LRRVGTGLGLGQREGRAERPVGEASDVFRLLRRRPEPGDGDRVEAARRVEQQREDAVRAAELLEREAMGEEVEAAAAELGRQPHAKIALLAQHLERARRHLAGAVDLERDRLERLRRKAAQRGAQLAELGGDLDLHQALVLSPSSKITTTALR